MTNREDYISKFNTLSQKFNSGQFPDMTSPAEIKELYTLIHELLIRQTEMEVFVEELKLAQFESELTRNKFEKLFRLAPIPYITIDKSGNILEMNAEAIKLLHSGNKSFNLLTSYLTADSKPIFSNFLETLDRSYEISSCDIEVRIFTSGKSFLKINGIRYEPDETTENIVYLISMIDVSKEKETEKRLRKITDNLKEINETKNRLLSVIAHDLRSPFHNLLGITEILLAHFHDYESEPTHKLLDGFEKIVKNQYNLVSNLLSWANLQSDNITTKPEIINLCDLLEECISLIRYELEKKGIVIAADIGKNITVLSDKTMISSVFLNFLTNAAKYSSQNGAISIIAAETNNSVSISVRDWGTGISEEKLKVLFSPGDSKSTPGTMGEKGTGLGLLIAKEYIERLRGQFLITSKLGEGTTITFTIPKDLTALINQ